MNSTLHRASRLLPALSLVALAACSGHAPRPQAPAAVAVAPGEIDTIQALLMQGEVKDARGRLKTLLKRDPMNASALVLRNAVDGDAKASLGPDSFAYTVRPGETMLDLAQRFLGNGLKAYQLAQYNGIANPATLKPGQVLRIPGEAPRIVTPRSEPVRAKPQPSDRTKPAAPAKPAAPPAAASAVNPAAARQARATGLAALNQGNVGRAVTMLRRAHALDPGNPLIARDLSRAERIAATVRSRR